MKAVKFAIFSLFTLSFILVSFSVSVFMGKQSEEVRRGEAEAQLGIQQVANKKLGLAYEQLGQAKKSLEQQLTFEQARIQEILKSLDKERQNRKQTESDLKITSRELNAMRLDYQTLSQSLDILQQKLKDLGASDYDVKQLTQAHRKTEIELPPVVVNAVPMTPGKILVVNRDFNFVVVDRGSQEGLRLGEFLIIKHKGKTVARVQAEKVYDHFSACAIVEESPSRKVRVDDTAKIA